MQRDARGIGRIRDMLTYAREVREFLSGVSEESYYSDVRVRRAVERSMEIVGEAASNVSAGVRDNYPEIDWPNIIGQRNVLAHGYVVLDDRRVWRVATQHIPALIPQLERMLAELTAEP